MTTHQTLLISVLALIVIQTGCDQSANESKPLSREPGASEQADPAEAADPAARKPETVSPEQLAHPDTRISPHNKPVPERELQGAESTERIRQHRLAFERCLALITEAGVTLKSAAHHRDAEQANKELQAITAELDQLRDQVNALPPLTPEQMRALTQEQRPAIDPVMAKFEERMRLVIKTPSLKQALNKSMNQLSESVLSIISPVADQNQVG